MSEKLKFQDIVDISNQLRKEEKKFQADCQDAGISKKGERVIVLHQLSTEPCGIHMENDVFGRIPV